MPNLLTFAEFVAKQTTLTQPPEMIDWAKNRDDWLNRLAEFFGLAKAFLHGYLENGQIQMTWGSKKIVEEYVGEYEATMATIVIGNKQITLEPIGTNLIGAKGRVDMIGPNGKVKFVLIDSEASAPRFSVQVRIQGDETIPELDKSKVARWAWKIATPPPNIRYIELTQESFFDALMEVANG